MSTFRLALALLLAANGVGMLAAPHPWFVAMPGVDATGPFNAHLVRDLGCAYAVAAAGIAWYACTRRAWPAALAGAIFLAAHAGVHAAEALGGRWTVADLARDFPGVFAAAAVALWLAWPPRASGNRED